MNNDLDKLPWMRKDKKRAIKRHKLTDSPEMIDKRRKAVKKAYKQKGS